MLGHWIPGQKRHWILGTLDSLEHGILQSILASFCDANSYVIRPSTVSIDLRLGSQNNKAETSEEASFDFLKTLDLSIISLCYN